MKIWIIGPQTAYGLKAGSPSVVQPLGHRKLYRKIGWLRNIFKVLLRTLAPPFLFFLLAGHYEVNSIFYHPLCHHLLPNHQAKGNIAKKLQTETSESMSKINFSHFCFCKSSVCAYLNLTHRSSDPLTAVTLPHHIISGLVSHWDHQSQPDSSWFQSTIISPHAFLNSSFTTSVGLKD